MPRRFASSTGTGTERALEHSKERRADTQGAASTPIVGPRDYQSRQTFPAAPWAQADSDGQNLWDYDVAAPPASVNASAASDHDFTNNEHDGIYGVWTMQHSLAYPEQLYADFAWAVPFMKFADYARVGILMAVSTTLAGATAPSDVLENVYLGMNSFGAAEQKTDILSSLVALDTYYWVYHDHAGYDISKWYQPRAWVEVKSKRFSGEEPREATTSIFIEYITVEQWNLYNTII